MHGAGALRLAFASKGDLNKNAPLWVSFVTVFLSEAVNFGARRGSASPSPLGKVARGRLSRTVTDEGSPPAAGLTEARTFENSVACGEEAEICTLLLFGEHSGAAIGSQRNTPQGRGLLFGEDFYGKTGSTMPLGGVRIKKFV